MRSNRRQVLTALAASGVALAGCVSENSNGNGDDDDDGNGGATGDPPESKLPDEPFPEGCPTYDGVDRVICYGAVDAEDMPAILEPSAREIGEGDPLTLTLRNQSEDPLQTNFYNWRLSKRVDGEWFWIEPREWPEPLMTLEPGKNHEWTLTIDNESIESEPITGTMGTGELDFEGLGGGHYAFRGRGRFEGETYDDTYGFAATFKFDSDFIKLTPTDEIEETEWDGDTLVAHSSRGDPESHTLGAFELQRLDEHVGETETVITEKLIRNDQRRDTVALAETYDADHVRLEEYSSTVPIFGSRSDGVFEYQGTYYEVSTREIEE